MKPGLAASRLTMHAETHPSRSCKLASDCLLFCLCPARGCAVKSVVVENHQVKANFWDLAGAAEYFEVRNEFYRDAQGALLVFDVGNRSSFEALDAWVEEAHKYVCLAVCV